MGAFRLNRRIKNFWFGFVLLLVVGGVFVLLGLSLLSSNMDVIKHGTYTKGTVIEMVKHIASKSTTYTVVIEYVTSTGARIRSESPTGSNSKAYKAGDKVTIIYSESDPNKFLFDKFFDKYGFPVIFIFAGVLCLIINILQTVQKIRRSILTR